MAKKKKFNDFDEMDYGYTCDGEYEDDWDRRPTRKKATRSDKYRDSRNRKRQYDFGEEDALNDE